MHKRARRTAGFVNENVRGCHGEKWVKHYSSDHRILLVGEGDFSFSLSLAVSFGSGSNIVATSRDTLGALIKKYKKVESNLETLKNLGASVLHGVDATQMQCHESLRMYKFDRIVFNFPHAGFHGKEANSRMIEMHRKLLRGFFSNAIILLETHGEVHVTHKTAPPYCLWNIKELASSNSLSLIDSVDFQINDYPGYSNKRGHGANSDDPFPLGECRTFKFMMSRGSRPHIYSDFDCKTYQLLEYKRDNMINYHNYGQLTPTVCARRETEGVSNVYKHAVLKYGSEVNNPGGPIKQMQMQNWERLVQARSSQQLKGDPILLQHENAPFNSRHPEQIFNIERDKLLGYVPTPRIINFRSEDSIEPGSSFNRASKTRDGSFNFYLDEPLRCHHRNYMGKAWDRTLDGYPSMSASSMVCARRETEGVSNVYKHAVLKYGSEVNNPGGPIKQMQMQNWERLVQARSSQQLKGDPILLQHENAPFNSRHPEQIFNIDRDKFLGYVPTPRIINFRSEDSIEPGSCFNHASKTRDGSFNFYLDEPLRCHHRNYMVRASDRTLNGYSSVSPSSRRELVRLQGRQL